MNVLTNRAVTPWDAAMVVQNNRRHRCRAVPWYQGAQIRTGCARTHFAYANSPSNFVAVIDQSAPGELLGVIGYEVVGHSATVIIMLNTRDKRVRGAGRRICAPFVRALLQQPNVWRVWSYCHVDNVRGQRVTERSGATCEGIMRRYAMFPNISDEPQDCKLYAIVR